VKELSLRYARMLGLPVVMANKCGPWVSPMPGIPFHVERSSFPGLSAVADSDGTLKAQLGDGEGVIVEDVRLDPSRKIHTGAARLRPMGLERPIWLLVAAADCLPGDGSLWASVVLTQRGA